MTEFWQENLTLAPADITSLRMPEVFVNHKDCFLNLQCKFSQFLLSSCQDFVRNYPCSSLLCMRPWEFSKYLAKEMQISTLLRKDKQQELGSSKQFLVQLLSKQWSCCFCWQLKQSQKQSHLSRQRAVVSLLVVSHHFLLLSWNHPSKKKSKALLPGSSRVLDFSASSEIQVLSFLLRPYASVKLALFSERQIIFSFPNILK